MVCLEPNSEVIFNNNTTWQITKDNKDLLISFKINIDIKSFSSVYGACM